MGVTISIVCIQISTSLTLASSKAHSAWDLVSPWKPKTGIPLSGVDSFSTPRPLLPTKEATMTHNGNNLAYRAYLRNHGFALIEILIVIVIIGMLAAIAIPQFVIYRSRSIDAQLKSDLRNAAVAVEGYFAKRSVYPASIEEAEAFGFHPTSGVTVL
jgi:prepilin-type N-terminal cleavage/methylation domain-containing protein